MSQSPKSFRIRRALGLSLVGALALSAAVFGRAYAKDEGGDRRAAFMQRIVNHKVDAALDAVQATPKQRTAIYAVRDRVSAEARKTFEGGRGQHDQDFETALSLLTADTFDRDRANALLSQRSAEAQARWQQLGQTALGAVAEVHDILTPAQRRTLAEHLREQRAAHHPHHGE